MSDSSVGDPQVRISRFTQVTLALVQGLLPAMTAVIGGLWIVFTYVDNQNKQANLNRLEQEKQTKTRLIEAQKPFLEKQLALYFETAQVAGNLVTLDPSDPAWQKAEKRFWALYWSELSMVESSGVEAAMKEVGDILLLGTTSAERTRLLRGPVYKLAHAIRTAIEQSWGR